eukprot:764658-Hanusia_phi.AAC.16
MGNSLYARQAIQEDELLFRIPLCVQERRGGGGGDMIHSCRKIAIYSDAVRDHPALGRMLSGVRVPQGMQGESFLLSLMLMVRPLLPAARMGH